MQSGQKPEGEHAGCAAVVDVSQAVSRSSRASSHITCLLENDLTDRSSNSAGPVQPTHWLLGQRQPRPGHPADPGLHPSSHPAAAPRCPVALGRPATHDSHTERLGHPSRFPTQRSSAERESEPN